MLVMPWTGGGAPLSGGGAPPPTTISDTFSSDTSANYTAITGSGFAVSGGYATMGADEWAYGGVTHNTALDGPDHYIDITAEELATGTVNALVRSNGTTGYVIQIYYDGTAINLETVNGSTTTYAGTFAGGLSYTAGFHRFRLECSGATFTLKHWNGASFDTVGTVTDSTYTTGNKVGLWFRNNGAKSRVDSLSAGSL